MNFIIDVDYCICKAEVVDGRFDYKNAKPIPEMIRKIRSLYMKDHKIILYTARSMKTYNGDLEKINKFTRPVLERWLQENNVPYDLLYFGKLFIPGDTYYIGDEVLTMNQFINEHEDSFENIRKENCEP